jgi:predicted GH43/DUF377 family glycosyl hydrolase
VRTIGWCIGPAGRCSNRNDPTRVLARSERPLFEPSTVWEKVGQVPNVVFVEGLVMEPERWLVYYGGADTHVGVASVVWRSGK